MFNRAVQRIRAAKERNDTELDLSQLELVDIPDEIGDLPQLTKLDLSNNKLHELPDTLRPLSNLTWLDLSANEFPAFPPEVLEFTALTELAVTHNLLQTLPEEFATLKNLLFLNISDNKMEGFPEVICSLPSLEILWAFKSFYTEIPEKIGEMKSLKTLNLVNNQLASLPESLGTLKQLEVLSLASNRFEFFPEVILELSNLKSLTLGSNNIQEIPKGIHRLQLLEEFHINYNEIRSLPKEFSLLKNIANLDLSKNNISTFPEQIFELQNLKTLRLKNNGLTSIPGEIKKLSLLNKLEINDNKLQKLPIEISTLKELETLSISSNQITEIPEEIVLSPKLDTFNFYRNPLITFPEEVIRGGFISVKEYLNTCKRIQQNLESGDENFTITSKGGLNAIPNEISSLVHLKKISISDCPILRLPTGFSELQNLEEFRLVGNRYRMRKFPTGLLRLSKLKKIVLNQTDIIEIPPDLVQLQHLEEVDLLENSIGNIPPEILARGWEAIRQFLLSLSGAAFSVMHEAKIIVVGSGGVGKTTLTRKLIQPDFDITKEEEASTEGIDIRFWRMLLEDERELMCNVWDFGGQEIYHATHQFFLTKRTLYLFVTEARKEDNYLDFDYWLNIIQVLSANSPVLIVLNKTDERLKEVDEVGLKKKFPNIAGFHRTSCLDGRGIQELNDHIESILSVMPHISSEIPDSWKSVRKELGQLGQERNFLTISEYREICEKNNISLKEANVLSNYLHDMGAVIHFRDDMVLNHTVILRPEWGTHAVYNVLDTPEVIKNLGSFTNEDLQKIWRAPEYPPERHPALLALMKKFGLCFQIEPATYIAPQLLPIQPPAHDRNYNQGLSIEYRYSRFMPPGIFIRFLVEFHHAILQHLFWKHGMVIEWERAQAKVAEDLMERKITIQAKGENPQVLMGLVRHHFELIHNSFPGLEVQEMLPCHCSECTSAEVPHYFPLSRLQKFKKKGKETITCDRSVEEINIQSLFSGFEKRSIADLTQTEKIKILFLASNPSGTSRLRLGREIREIEEGLRGARYRDRFELNQRWAVRPEDLQKAFLDISPQVVHFSGHGLSDVGDEIGEGRSLRRTGSEPDEEGALVLEDEFGQAQEVSETALANLFGLFKKTVSCVILNACYSANQADSILEHIPYVIGMRTAIPDEAAIAFSKGFYDAIGAGRNIEEAYHFGRNAIELYGISGVDIPVLRKR